MINKRNCRDKRLSNPSTDNLYSSQLPTHSLIDCPSQLTYNANMDINLQSSSIKLTKIVCTIGPSTRDVKVLEDLMLAGMDIARLNFSHGDHEYHQATVDNIRQAAQNVFNTYDFPIALDTKGPEIRTGIVLNDQCTLETGANVILTTDISKFDQVTSELIYVDYNRICDVIKPNAIIYIDDGNLMLRAQKIHKNEIECLVEVGGILKSKKGVNLPGVPVDLPAVTEKDKEDLMFAIKNNLDFVFASFIRDAAAVRSIKLLLEPSNIKVISKLENEQGLLNASEIIDESDGIMVARGDMGVEIPVDKVYIAQRMLIAKCQIVGKPVICATQMLDSMTKNPRPTRAEVSDVAFAVYDGADCVMLSGETANGLYPIEVVKTQSLIARRAETTFPYTSRFQYNYHIQQLDPTSSIALSAVLCSFTCRAIGIIVLTTNGRSATLISKYRPRCPIICVTRNQQTARFLALYRGCIVQLIDSNEKLCSYVDDIEMRVNIGLKKVMDIYQDYEERSQSVVVLTGAKPGLSYVNVLRIMTIPTNER